MEKSKGGIVEYAEKKIFMLKDEFKIKLKPSDELEIRILQTEYEIDARVRQIIMDKL